MLYIGKVEPVLNKQKDFELVIVNLNNQRYSKIS